MKLIDFATRRPVSVFIFAVAAVVFGAVAFQNLATDLLPDISYPSLTVRTTYEGAAPAEIESLVTRPVENGVGVVTNVVRVVSSSRTDVSEVTLEFSWGTNMDLAALDVRERLDLLRLPTDAERPLLLRYDPSLDPILRLGLYGEEDLIRLRLIGEEQVKRALERIEGVAAVVVAGGLEEEIQVELDERRMANLGIDSDQVFNRLGQENINVTGGRLKEGQTEFLVRTINEFVGPEDLLPIVIDSSRGAIVRLEDVARVRRGHKERELITRINGQESVEVAVYKEGGTNTVRVSDLVTTAMEPLEARLREVEPNLRLAVVTDQARYIRQSVSEVLRTAVWGGSLAILVLFRRRRAALPNRPPAPRRSRLRRRCPILRRQGPAPTNPGSGLPRRLNPLQPKPPIPGSRLPRFPFRTIRPHHRRNLPHRWRPRWRPSPCRRPIRSPPPRPWSFPGGWMWTCWTTSGGWSSAGRSSPPPTSRSRCGKCSALS